jgi:probable F420-dependent oxidoreductase
MRFTIWHSGGDADAYFRTAEAAEENGWTSMCLHESVFFPEQASAAYPYTEDGKRHWPPETPFLDPMILLAGVLARTTTLRTFTFVLKFPLRHPLLVAKQAATAAVMSDNRFALGVGQSVWPEEFANTDTDFETRRQRLIEGVEIVRLATSGEMVEYHGENYDFGRLQQAPGASEPLPIYLGGHKAPSLRLAAEIADGWCGVPSTYEEMERCIGRLDAHLDERGRDRSAFPVHAGVLAADSVDDFRRMEEVGITDAIVTPWAAEELSHADEVSTAAKLEAIERFSDRVVSAF